jgi:transposase-like protein
MKLFLTLITISLIQTVKAQTTPTNLVLVDPLYINGLKQQIAQLEQTIATTTNLPPSPVIASSMQLVTKKPKIRTFIKNCPECGQPCVSTNLVWSGGSTTEQFGTVRFNCTFDDCGNMFQEEIREPIKKSPPMKEITGSLTK